MPYPNTGRAVWSGDTIAVLVAYKQRLEQLATLPIRHPRDTPDRTLHTYGWHRCSPWHEVDDTPDRFTAELTRWAP